MKLEKVKLKDLKPHPENYNKHPEKQVVELSKSLDKFGQFKNIVIDENNTILAGHGLVMAMQKNEVAECQAYRAKGLTEDQKLQLLVADNILPAGAESDNEMLKNILDGLPDPLDIPGIDQDFLDDLGFMDEPESGLIGDDDIPDESEIESICKTGDIWQLGEHRLLCGDCTDKRNVELLMQDEVAELLFTSPPYADMRDYGGCDLSIEKLKKFISVFYPFAKYQAVNLGLKRKNHEIVEYWQEYIQEAKDAGYKFLSWNIWNKKEAGSVSNQTAFFSVVHEWLFVFGYESKKLNKTIECRTFGDSGWGIKTRRQKDGTLKKDKIDTTQKYKHMETIIDLLPAKSQTQKDNSHPAMFPVELPLEYINAMTDENDIVAEPFGGSGTTLIACEKTNRKCRMIEIDEKYCDIIIKRWQDYTDKEAVKI